MRVIKTTMTMVCDEKFYRNEVLKYMDDVNSGRFPEEVLEVNKEKGLHRFIIDVEELSEEEE